MLNDSPASPTALCPRARPIPDTASGGTRATAIATPAIELIMLRRVWAKAAAPPAAIATPRSISVGDVRFRISDPVILNPNRSVVRYARTITRITPQMTVKIDRVINRLSNTTRPYERLIIGAISGAMIMAPIIAGALLFAMRPNVAITAASASMKKKANEGIET